MPGSIYIHVPFTADDCKSGDAYEVPAEDLFLAQFSRRLIKEIESVAASYPVDVRSIYIGGGDPLLLGGEALRRIIESARRSWNVEDGIECSIELRDLSFQQKEIDELAAAGATRFSITAQTIGRGHGSSPSAWARTASRAMHHLRCACAASINIDVIYGGCHDSVISWEEVIEHLLQLAPEHVTCIEAPFKEIENKKRLDESLPCWDDWRDASIAMYAHATERLKWAGYEHYEIGTWCRGGHQSVHLVHGLMGRTIFPCGPGACGSMNGFRWMNMPSITEYLAGAGMPAVHDVELPDLTRISGEAFVLGLRLAEGIEKGVVDAACDKLFGHPAHRHAIEQCILEGLLEWSNDRLRLTQEGLWVADTVIDNFV